jgi:putative membrane protein
MRFLAWLIGLPLAAVVVAFAVANRAPVVLVPWPLPFEIEMPVYLLALGAALGGFLLGVLVGRLSGRGR